LRPRGGICGREGEVGRGEKGEGEKWEDDYKQTADCINCNTVHQLSSAKYPVQNIQCKVSSSYYYNK